MKKERKKERGNKLWGFVFVDIHFFEGFYGIEHIKKIEQKTIKMKCISD